jgi:glycerol-1-phosphate dehydrogenase [NAD(P)+]
MELLEVKLPKNIAIGKGALEKIGSICSDLGLRGSVTIFTGEGTLEVAGKRVAEKLEFYDFKTSIVQLTKKVEIKDLKMLNSDFIMGVGGGRVIDFAKMTAKVSNRPFVSFPTAISHDGIASNRAVIGDIYSVPAVMPDAIVIDTDIIAKSPYRLTASGCGDIVAKITAVEDWKISHRKTGEYISDYSAAINKTSAETILECANSIRKLEDKGIRNLIEALVFSGVSMSIAGSSRPSSGSEHLFSHALKMLYPQKVSLHGEECAVGAILCSYLQGGDWRKIANALKVIGVPTTSEELGIPKNIIIDALVKAKEVRYDRYTILNDKDVNPQTAKAVAEETGVISR